MQELGSSMSQINQVFLLQDMIPIDVHISSSHVLFHLNIDAAHKNYICTARQRAKQLQIALYKTVFDSFPFFIKRIINYEITADRQSNWT